MWSVCKAVNNIVENVLVNRRVDQLMEFETSLKRNRASFLSPISNPSKSVDDRRSVKKADVEAIAIPSLSQRIILTQDLIEESCCLSDLFDLNEITALELVLTAEGHLSSQTGGFNRLTLATILYFDAHYALADTLNLLLQHREGRIHSSNPIPREVANVVNSITEDLWQSGLLNNLLSFLAKFNVDDQLKRLESSRVIGSRQHRRDVLRLLTKLRNRLAECVMLWAAQTPLSSQEMSLVLKHLISSTLTPEKGGEKEAVSMPLNHGSIHLIMALLFSLEPFGTPGINVDQYADADEQDLLHPIFSEAGYVATVTELFTQVGVADQPPSAAVEGLYGLLQLAWGIALRRTTHLRMDLRRRGDNASGTNVNANGDSVDEDDLVASALRSRTIEFLSVGLLSEPHFPQEPQWVHRVHNLLTELLIQFPQNVRDIRLWDESVARRVGVDPGGFAILLDAIGRLYNVPGSPLHARLSLEYWWPAGETVVAPSEALNASFRAGEVENSRQAILFRFVYSASEFASSPLIFVSYVRILRSLVGCQTSSNLCFNLLKATASSGGRLASLLTWDHFITSLQQYLEHLKRAAAVEPDTGSQPLHLQHPHLYYSMGGQSQRDQKQQASPVPLEIQPEELEALQIVAALITRVAALDPVARSAFATNTKWCLIPTAVGLITCPLPMSMKAELLHLLSALSRTPTIAAEVWRNLWESRLLSFIEPSSNLAVSGSLASLRSVVGLHTEIDKAEARVEEYPITLGFINLLTTLAPSLLNCPATVTGSESPTPATDTGESMSRLVHFTIETVFLKHTMRAYRRPNERWEIAASCVVLFEGLVRTFLHRMHSVAILSAGASRCSDAQLATFDWTPLLNGQVNLAKLTLPRGWPFTDPGYQIVAQLLTNSSLFCLLTDLLEVGLYRLLEYSVNASSCAMARTTAAILRLFDQILPHEQMVVNLVRRAALVMPHLRPETAWGQRSGASVILPSLLSRLLVVTINSRTGRADLLVTIVRYCGLSDDLPDHCTSALNILCSVVRAVQPHDSVLAVFTSDKKTEQDLLRALVSCLSTSMEDLPDTSGVESVPIFSDAWLNTDTAGDIAGVDSGSWRGPLQPHPSLKVARTLAAFPIMPSDWDMAEARWEAMAAFPPSSLSETTGVSREADVIQVLCHGPQGHGSSVRSMILHLILFALTHHPSPSIAHWLLGFRSKNARSIAITTLQDAGVGGFPRTCLHGILDLVDVAVASLRESSLDDFDEFPPHLAFLALQWDAAVAWQILYHLMSAFSTTGVPISRYLRGNHDLIARHLTTGLVSAHLASPSAPAGNSAANALRSIVLNQCSWLLKMAAIEIQFSTSQRTYLARLLTNLFATGDAAATAAVTDESGVGFSHGASVDRFSLLHPQPDSALQGRILADLLSHMDPSEAMISPLWVFDHDCAESRLVEDIVVACEEPFPLIPNVDQAALRSGVINTLALARRLNVFLDGASGDVTDALVSDVAEWAQHRNAHRLALVSGKQAYLEGWRHLAEISMRMLHFLARVNPDVLSLTSTTSAATVSVNRYLFSSAMSLLGPMLRQVCAPETSPAVLKVLASGSCLSLAAFLQIFASPSSADGAIANPKCRGAQGVLSITQLLLEAVLSSKPTQQRARANYYGALCYVLDVCQQLDQQMAASSDSTVGPPMALRAINILSGSSDCDVGSGVRSSLLTILFNDLSRGHHPIIPISALGLLCMLMKLDRASGQILETVIRDGCLQSCVDSLEDDLAILQQFLLTQSDSSSSTGMTNNGTGNAKGLIDATAVFYVYQSKMAFLTLAASTQLGAKSLIQTHLLDSTLCRFEPLSGSCLAEAFNFSVAAARGGGSGGDIANENQSDPLAWLDSHEFAQFLLAMVNKEEAGQFFGCASGLIEPLVTSQLLSVSGSSPTTSADPGQCLTWIGILEPALAFAKALAFTLGPSHVSAVQKVSRFVYTHSDALLTVGASTSAARLALALTQECFQEDGGEATDARSSGRQEQLVLAILQWLHGEESLAHLLSFILRARIPSSLAEPDDLPRELLRSKTLRHVFAILHDLFQALQVKEQRSLAATGSISAKQTFMRNLITTKQLTLLRVLVTTCVAAVSTEDEFGNFESTFLKNLIFSSSLSPRVPRPDSTGEVSVSDGPSGRPSLHLLLQLVSWSASRLHHLETAVTSTTRHLPPSLLVVNRNASTKGEEGDDSRRVHANPPVDKVLQCLIDLPVAISYPGEEISTDGLRQIATSIFSVWAPITAQLLQTNTFGIDAGQRNAYLRRFIAVGGGLLQTQLSCLIDVLEQSLYLLWRHVMCFVNVGGSRQEVLIEAEVRSNSSSTPRPPTRLPEVDHEHLLDQLPRRLSFDLLDSVTQVSKAPYLSSNDQLFLQVMVQRLDRLSQTRSRMAERTN